METCFSRYNGVSFDQPLRTKIQKCRTLPKQVFYLLTIWTFQTKILKIFTISMENKAKEPKDPKTTTELRLCNQEEIYCSKNEKSIQVKLLGFYKAETRKKVLTCSVFLQPRWIMTQTLTLARLQLLGNFRNFFLISRTFEKEGFFKLCKHWFHRNSVRRIEKENIMKTSPSTLWNNPVEHKGPE